VGHHVAAGEHDIVQVAGVVVAGRLLLAVDFHPHPAAAVAGHLDRGAGRDHPLAALGVVAVADPAAVAAHVAAQVALVPVLRRSRARGQRQAERAGRMPSISIPHSPCPVGGGQRPPRCVAGGPVPPCALPPSRRNIAPAACRGVTCGCKLARRCSRPIPPKSTASSPTCGSSTATSTPPSPPCRRASSATS